MNIKRIIREEIDSLDWMGQSSVGDLFSNTAFYFNPPIDTSDYDGEIDRIVVYNKITELIRKEGGKPIYSTPSVMEGHIGFIYGIYSFLMNGELKYVYTVDLDESYESYEIHIREFSKDESDHSDSNMLFIDGEEFIKGLI